jgi:hypothetical protein
MKKDLISASQHSGGDAAVKTNMSSVDGTGVSQQLEAGRVHAKQPGQVHKDAGV